MKESLRSGTCSLLKRPGLPHPSPLHRHPCPCQIPPDLSHHWLTLGRAELPWQLMGCAVPGPCSPRLVPLHSCTQPSPAQLRELPRQPDCTGLQQPHPLSRPSVAEISRGLELGGLYGLLSASTGLLLPCQQRLGPAVSQLPRTLWILFALSLGRQAGLRLVFGELFPAASPSPHRFLLWPASSNHWLSKTPLHSPRLCLGEMSQCLERWPASRSKDSGSNPSSALPRCVSWPELPEQSTTNWVQDALLVDVSVQISPFYKDASYNG